MLELEAQIGRFNVFDALGIVRAEIRHSAFLRWLLDPSESHGLGTMFLRPVLMDILRDTEPERRPLSPIDLDGVELRNVEVTTETERIDILISCDEPRFVVAVENKVDSGEHSGQLKRYRDAVARMRPDHPPLFVYLTREGDDPSDEAWTPYSYRQLHDVMTRVVRTNEGAIGDDVRVFVDHYVSLLRSRFMNDPTIEQLVEKIYRKHRQAIDLIIERKSDPRRAPLELATQRLQAEPDRWYIDEGSPLNVYFLPKVWLDLLPPINKQPRKHPSAWVRCRFSMNQRTGYVMSAIHLLPTEDVIARESLLDSIARDGGPHHLKQASKPGAKWQRVYRRQMLRVTDANVDQEAFADQFDKALAKFITDVEGLTKIIESVYR